MQDNLPVQERNDRMMEKGNEWKQAYQIKSIFEVFSNYRSASTSCLIPALWINTHGVNYFNNSVRYNVNKKQKWL